MAASKKEKQQRAAEKQRQAFRNLGDLLENQFPKIQTHYRVVKNNDGSVDGELRVSNIPRGLQVHGKGGILAEVEADFRPPPDHWMNIRFMGTFEPKDIPKEKKAYERRQGMDVVAVYPSRHDPNTFFVAQEIAENIKTRRRKPQQVAIRLYWNPKGKKPQKR